MEIRHSFENRNGNLFRHRKGRFLRNQIGAPGIAFCLLIALGIYAKPPIHLANLDYKNKNLKNLREEIRINLQASRSHSGRHIFTDLKFYTYKVQKEDNFFLIMSKTSMDMDTLTSVNGLSSPYEIYPGQLLKIPNMRGIYIEDTRKEDATKQGGISQNEKKQKGIRETTDLDESGAGKKIFDRIHKKWFLPGGRLENREKMFFYGKIFHAPLEEYRISSKYGKRSDPFTNKQTFHGGVDLAAPKGTAVYASANGVVDFVGKKGGYGNLIIIRHDHGYETRYGHLSKFAKKIKSGNLKKGTRVSGGEKIGEVGMTGRATGNHLHFEVRRFSKPEKPVLR